MLQERFAQLGWAVLSCRSLLDLIQVGFTPGLFGFSWGFHIDHIRAALSFHVPIHPPTWETQLQVYLHVNLSEAIDKAAFIPMVKKKNKKN